MDFLLIKCHYRHTALITIVDTILFLLQRSVQMKKITLLITLGIMLTSTAFASSSFNSFKGHWSERFITEDRLNTYLALITNSAKTVKPDLNISYEDFDELITNIYDNKLGSSSINFKDALSLSRKEACQVIYDRLLVNKIIDLNEILETEVSFKDIGTLSIEEAYPIKVLYNLGIINGFSKDEFKPNNHLSYAQSFLILQKVEELIKTTVVETFTDFEILSETIGEKSYSDISVISSDEYHIISITEEFPESGYTIKVDKLETNADGNIIITLRYEQEGDVHMQVISYRTLKLKLPKTSDSQNVPSIEVRRINQPSKKILEDNLM